MDAVRVPGMAMAGLSSDDNEVVIEGFRAQWAPAGQYEVVERYPDGGATIKKVAELDVDQTEVSTISTESREAWTRRRVSTLTLAVREYMLAEPWSGWALIQDWTDEIADHVRWLNRMERNSTAHGTQALQASSKA